MGESELWHQDATALAELIRTRQVSAAEVVRAHLDRIEAVNPKINAVVTLLAAQALAAAVARLRAAGALPLAKTNLPEFSYWTSLAFHSVPRSECWSTGPRTTCRACTRLVRATTRRGARCRPDTEGSSSCPT